MMRRPTCLYRAYGDDGRLLYVGIASDVEERMKQHAATAGWVDHLASLVITRYPDRPTAVRAELEAIRSEWPVWNVHGSPFAAASPAAVPKPWRSEPMTARELRRHCQRHEDRTRRVSEAVRRALGRKTLAEVTALIAGVAESMPDGSDVEVMDRVGELWEAEAE